MAMKQLKISQSVTNRAEASIQSFFNEVAGFKQLTADEEVALARKIKTAPTESERVSARNKLVESNLRFVISCAKQYQNSGVALTDLMQEGNIGLIRAAESFDETKGFKFISYAVWWIRQSIMQYLNESRNTIRIPVNKVAMLTAIAKAKNEFFANYGTEPSLSDLAFLTNYEEDDIAKVLNEGQCQNTSSMDAPLSDDSDSTFESIYNGGGDATDKSLMEESLVKEVRQAISFLNDKEQHILIHLYGLGGSPIFAMSEIAEDLNLSRERVRQIHSNALGKLRVHKVDLRNYLS